MAYIRLADSARRRRNLPHGCAVLAGRRFCVPRVSVNGVRLPDIGVLGELVGLVTEVDQARLFAHSAPTTVSEPSYGTMIHEAVAMAVFERVRYLAAVRDGMRARAGAARALARRELRLYRSSARPASRMIPPGMSVRAYFLSPRQIAGYRLGLLEGRERQRIIGIGRAGITYYQILDSWFSRVLRRYRILVNGMPPRFSLPRAARGHI